MRVAILVLSVVITLTNGRSATRATLLKCPSLGNFPHPLTNNPRKYIECTETNSGVYEAKNRKCSENQVFDPSSQKCEFNQNLGRALLATSADYDEFTCEATGLYEDPSSPDCEGYYQCVAQDGALTAVPKVCPNGEIFMPELSTCVTPQFYNCPRGNPTLDPDQEQKTTDPTEHTPPHTEIAEETDTTTTTEDPTTDPTTEDPTTSTTNDPSSSSEETSQTTNDPTSETTSEPTSTTEASTSSTTEETTSEEPTTEQSTTEMSTTEESTTEQSSTEESTTRETSTESSSTTDVTSTTQETTTTESTTAENTSTEPEVTTTVSSSTEATTTEEPTTPSEASTTEETTTEESTESTSSPTTESSSTTEVTQTTESSSSTETISTTPEVSSTSEISSPSTEIPSTETSTTATEIITTTDESTTGSSSTAEPTLTTSQTTPATSKPFVCESSGSFPNPDNKKTFYLCIPDGNSYLLKLMNCRTNMTFDPNLKVCLDPAILTTTEQPQQSTTTSSMVTSTTEQSSTAEESTTNTEPATSQEPTSSPSSTEQPSTESPTTEQPTTTETTKPGETSSTQTPSTTVGPFVCKSSGTFANPQNNTSFYVCLDNGDNSYIGLLMPCRDNQVFDKTLKFCVSMLTTLEPTLTASTEESTTTTSSEENITTSVEYSTSEPTKKPPFQFECPGPGYYENPDNRITFYFCVSQDVRTGIFFPILIECRKDLVFYPEYRFCAKPQKVTTTIRPETIPTEETSTQTEQSSSTPKETTEELTTKETTTSSPPGTSTTSEATSTSRTSTSTEAVTETTTATEPGSESSTEGGTSSPSSGTTEVTPTTTTDNTSSEKPESTSTGASTATETSSTELPSTTASVTVTENTSTGRPTTSEETTETTETQTQPENTSSEPVPTTDQTTTPAVEHSSSERPTSSSKPTESTPTETQTQPENTSSEPAPTTDQTTTSGVEHSSSERPTSTSDSTESTPAQTSSEVTSSEKSSTTEKTDTTVDESTTSEETTIVTPEAQSAEILVSKSFVCPKAGTFAHPSNHSIFYLCISDGAKGYVPLIFECGSNQVFDEKRRLCEEPRLPLAPAKNVPMQNNIQPTPYICKSAGTFLDPVNCQKYYYCANDGYGGFIAVHLQCPYDLNYFPSLRICTKKTVYSCDTPKPQLLAISSSFKCISPGQHPDPSNCRSFFVCIFNGEGNMISQKNSCPIGYVFARNYGICVDQSYHPCEIDAGPRAQSVAPFRCTEKGTFPDPHNRRNYYFCLEKRNGFHAIHKSCRTGLIYSKEMEICVHEWFHRKR